MNFVVFGQSLKRPGGCLTLPAMLLNGVFQRRRPAVVQVGGRIGDAPERRRPPFVALRRATGVAVTRRSIVMPFRFQRFAHAVKKQVAVDALSAADIRHVADGAAHGIEFFLAAMNVVKFRFIYGHLLTRRRQ